MCKCSYAVAAKPNEDMLFAAFSFLQQTFLPLYSLITTTNLLSFHLPMLTVPWLTAHSHSVFCFQSRTWILLYAGTWARVRPATTEPGPAFSGSCLTEAAVAAERSPLPSSWAPFPHHQLVGPRVPNPGPHPPLLALLLPATAVARVSSTAKPAAVFT